MQRNTIYLFLWNALYVSGDSSAHHQELKNCIYSIGYFVKPLLLLPATVMAGGSKGLTKYPMLYIQFSGSWWWAAEPPETCSASVEINKSRRWSDELDD